MNASIKKKDRRLIEHFINSINDDDMMTEMIRELATIKKKNEIINELVLSWDRTVKMQRAHTVIIVTANDNKEFNALKYMSKGTMTER